MTTDTTRAAARPRLTGLAVLTGVALAGCSPSGPNQYPLSGAIRIGNQPITGGFVTIEPADGGVKGGLDGHAPIRNGRYDTEDGGRRTVAGSVVLRVSGWGEPSSHFKNGVPLCNRYEVRVQLKSEPNTYDIVIPETARVKEPVGGWGQLP